MRRRVCLLLGLTGLLVLAALAAGGAPAAPAGPAHPPRSASSPRSGSSRLRPRAFASCPGLTAYARRHLAATHGLPEPPVTPLAQPGLAPAPLGASGVAAPVTAGPTDGGSGSAVTFSTTNNQEQGVDEPDIVKTDGSTIFALSRGTLYAVMLTGGTPRLAGSLALGASGAGAELLLRGSRVIVISGREPLPLAGRGGPVPLGGAPGR